MKFNLIIVLLLFFSVPVFAQTTYTLLASCDTDDECSWNDGTSWVGGVAPLGGTPSSGDIIVIPAGTWVELEGPGSTSVIDDGSDVTVQVYGTLDFDGNARLELLDANSVIQLAPGAVLDVDDATGSSARIQIGGTSIKSSEIDALVSPNQLTEGTIAGGGCAVTMTCDGDPLPVELLFLNAKVINKKVELVWATASEENFDYFSIEHSLDGKNFFEIAQVPGNGSSYQRIDYSYTEDFPSIGFSYYRLRSIDYDGYTEIFENVIVKVEGVNHSATVFPNPVISGVVNVQINFDLKEGAQVLLFNNMGHLALSLSITSWLTPLDISSLQPGSYIIKIITQEGVFAKQIMLR